MPTTTSSIPTICNFCMDCVSPCPTGSINHFVLVAKPLFARRSVLVDGPAAQRTRRRPPPASAAPALKRSTTRPPRCWPTRMPARAAECARRASASEPRINLFNRTNPATATVTRQFSPYRRGCERRRPPRHPGFRRPVPFPVLEGQSIGIAAARRRRQRAAAHDAALFGREPARRRAAEHQQPRR